MSKRINNTRNNKSNAISKALTRVNDTVLQQQKVLNRLLGNQPSVNKYRMDLPRDPIKFRTLPKEKVVDALDTFHSLTRSRYLYSMIHPDIAVSEGLQVKLYSDVPVPTSSIGFRQIYQLSTSDKGTFALTWTPNFFSNKEELITSIPVYPGLLKDFVSFSYSNFAYANNSFDGTTDDARFYYRPMYVPDIGLQKYRLVSAIMKVRYNGPVLQQSGTMISCATFDSDIPQVVCGTTDPTVDTANNVIQLLSSATRSKYGNFDLVRNGLWNYSQNITSDANGLEALYVPIDPSAHQFYPCCTFYGNKGEASPSIYPTSASNNEYYAYRQYTNEQGATLSYVVAGHNLPPSSNCVFVEIFYNFEVIADPNAAPILRSSINTSLDWNDHRRLTDVWQNMSKDGLIRGLLPPPSGDRSWGSFARKTIHWGQRLWPIISKLI